MHTNTNNYVAKNKMYFCSEASINIGKAIPIGPAGKNKKNNHYCTLDLYLFPK